MPRSNEWRSFPLHSASHSHSVSLRRRRASDLVSSSAGESEEEDEQAEERQQADGEGWTAAGAAEAGGERAANGSADALIAGGRGGRAEGGEGEESSDGSERAAAGAGRRARSPGQAVKLLVDDRKKYSSMWTRMWSGLWMISGFAGIIYMGHVFIWLLIMLLQIMMARELFQLSERALKARQRKPNFTKLRWYFFATAMVYVYGSFLFRQLMVSFTSDDSMPQINRFFITFIRYHSIISYAMYIFGFVWFILSLKSGEYKYQFGQFAWIHMILFSVFFQSSFFIANIFQGIIWFLLPCSLIIINDCSAYFFGFFFGRTPLIKLSPKKTWEGFMGASVTTIIFAFLLAGFMGQFDWLTCPRKDLSVGPLHCRRDAMFEPQPQLLPEWGRHLGLPERVWVSPLQRHAIVFGVFASSIAPFGGFFASGFKRAFKIKDFGEIIPGHGGITDRMDCQMVMAVFSNIYYQSFIAPRLLSVESLLSQAMRLEMDQMTELYVRLGNILQSRGIDLSSLHTSDPQLWS